MATQPTAAAFVEGLQGRGRYVFTRAEAARSLGRTSVARKGALRRLREKGRIVSPRRGFYVIVPVEYRSAGAPPASWYIDDLMGYFEQPYYVALLTAAGIHGAAHQQPQVFQVITNAPTRPAEAGRNRIEFHRSRGFADAQTLGVKTETGNMRVSTPAQTALDLVRYPNAAGQLDNVATVLVELAETIEPDQLVAVAQHAKQSDLQRLGYLLEHLELEELSELLLAVVRERRRRTVRLRPDLDSSGAKRDDRWYIIPNVQVEADA